MSSRLFFVSLDILIVVLLVIIGILILKSKGKNWSIGNLALAMKSPQECKKYDEKKISEYFGKTIFKWTIFFIIGAIVDCFAPGIGLMIALLLLVIGVVYIAVNTRKKRFDEKFKLLK